MSSVDTVDGDYATRTAEQEPVTVRKVPERRDDGIVIRYTLVSTADVPVEVTLVDELPPTEREEVGFHPDHTPISWSASDDEISIDHALDPHEECLLALGVVLGEESSFDPSATPAIEAVSRLSADQEKPTAEKRDDEGGLFKRARETLFSGNGEETTASDDDSPVEPLELVDPAEETGVEPEPESESRSDPEPNDVEVEPPADERANDDEIAEAATEDDSPSADTPLELELDDEELDVEQEGDAPAEENGADPESTAEDAVDDVDERRLVEALADELRDGGASEESLTAIRSQLLDDRVESSRSETVRLHHVQARMDDFAAYVDLLEEFIDEHGTIVEYAESVEASIEELDSTVTSVSDAVDELRAEQSSLRSRIASLESSHESVVADVDEIDEETTALREDHDAAIAELSTQQATIEREIDALEAQTDSELRELREAVESFESIRGTLANAFGPEATEAPNER